MPVSPAALLELLSAAAAAPAAAERRFVLLNRTRDALPYHAAVLQGHGALHHSGASHLDPQGPYGLWLAALLARCRVGPPGPFGPEQVEGPLADEWASWWPPYAVWLPAGGGEPATRQGLLLCRESPWTADEVEWLARWYRLWELTERAAEAGTPRRIVDWQALRARLGRPWRQRKGLIVAALLLAALCFPVRLTVRAPGELVPREPTVLRATVDGMARRLHVEPNQTVKAGQLLAELDDAAAASRLQVARQALATAEAEWRQTSQQALSDARAKAQLPVALGRMEEKRTEVDYLSEQVRRTELRAPHAGVVLLDDPGNWAGRTIAAGEPLLRLARPDDQEVEAWLPVADAVELPLGSPMRLFLASRPATPVLAQLSLYAFEAQPRPEGGLAYRLRGRIEGASAERLGSRGTVHVDGERVSLAYWMLRRPLAALREATGW